jgi:hypothetical protein
MIEKIFVENDLAAIIIRSSFKIFDSGIEFITDSNDSLQLGYMKRDKGYEIQPHIHKKIDRTISFTNEVLVIKKGKVRIDFYNNDKIFHSNNILYKGDIILLNKCGHGFVMMESSEIIEVKQGPYLGDNDKIRFLNKKAVS